MSENERERKVIMECVLSGQYTLNDAAERMGVSYRQAKRIKRRYIQSGDAGLVHQNRGKPSGRRKPNELKERVIALYKDKYPTFGPALAAEYMADEDGIDVNHETLRLWLKKAEIWTRKRRRQPYRQRRERRGCFGELLQIDGSDHHWFGKEHPRCTLFNMIDDATGTVLAMLDRGETTWGLLTILKKWIEKYGVPQAVYVDLKSVYVSPSKEGQSVFEVVCKKLDIKIIRAYSPQAKGRVERSHQVFQDRFVKELALRKVTDIESGNKSLESKIIKKFNEKFSKPAASKVDGHRDAKLYGNLNNVICWEYVRQVKNDYTVQLDNQHYQLLRTKGSTLRPKSKVVFLKNLNGRISIWYDGEKIKYRSIKCRPEDKPEKKEKKPPQALKQGHSKKNKSPWFMGGRAQVTHFLKEGYYYD